MAIWFYWIIIGFVAGVLAKAMSPGERNEPKGCLMTIILGIAGSMLTGFILHYLLHWQTGGHLIGTIIGATLGAMLLIWIAKQMSKR